MYNTPQGHDLIQSIIKVNESNLEQQSVTPRITPKRLYEDPQIDDGGEVIQVKTKEQKRGSRMNF